MVKPSLSQNSDPSSKAGEKNKAYKMQQTGHKSCPSPAKSSSPPFPPEHTVRICSQIPKPTVRNLFYAGRRDISARDEDSTYILPGDHRHQGPEAWTLDASSYLMHHRVR